MQTEQVDVFWQRRIKIMSKLLGDAMELIDNVNYLPMFRNRQKNYEEEFALSVKIAKTKKNPKRFFSKIWSKSKIETTLAIMRKMINQRKAKAREAVVAAKKKVEQLEWMKFAQTAKGKRYQAMKDQIMGKGRFNKLT